MGAARSMAQFVAPHSEEVHPFETGDRLSQRQFHAAYERMSEVKKAELVEGIVYMPSPVRYSFHGKPHLLLSTWLGLYISRHPDLLCGTDTTLILDELNEYQPDLFLAFPASRGGQLRENEQGYLTGTPELAIEVSASSVSIDLHMKKAVYERMGVKEYLVWRTRDGAIDGFVHREGKFVPADVGPEGVWRSGVFAGLALDVPAALRGDTAAVLAGLGK